jgi:hypothetical protein
MEGSLQETRKAADAAAITATTVWLAEDIHAFIARRAAEAQSLASSSRGVALTAARRRKRALRTPQGTP